MALVPCPGQQVTLSSARRRRGQRRGEQRVEEASWNLRVRQCGREIPTTAHVGAHGSGAPGHKNPHTTRMDHSSTHERCHAKAPPAFAVLPPGWRRSGARHGRLLLFGPGPERVWPEAVLQPHLVATTVDGSALENPSSVRPDQWRQSSSAARVPFASRSFSARRPTSRQPSIAGNRNELKR